MTEQSLIYRLKNVYLPRLISYCNANNRELTQIINVDLYPDSALREKSVIGGLTTIDVSV